MDLNANGAVMSMSKVDHVQFPIKYRVPQYSVPLIASTNWKHDRDTRYTGIPVELNGITTQVQCVSTATIPDPTIKGNPGVQPTEVSKIDLQNGFWQFPMGSPPNPVDHVVTMAAF